MRGAQVEASSMFSYLSPEQRIPQDHPLRAMRVIVDRSPAEPDHHFQRIYSAFGRPSIPPEHLSRALLLQVFYGIRSERQLVEQRNDNLLFRWFVGLEPDAAVWVPTVFTRNQEDRDGDGSDFRGQERRNDTHASVTDPDARAWPISEKPQKNPKTRPRRRQNAFFRLLAFLDG